MRNGQAWSGNLCGSAANSPGGFSRSQRYRMGIDMNEREILSGGSRGGSEFPLGRNIYRHRKLKKMTQEKLAEQLHVSCQAISKWENNLSVPDAMMLPQIAAALETSIDTLMGYIPVRARSTPYEEIYREGGYYWGIMPNDLAFEVLKIKYPTRPLKLLEVGCGEGRDAVFFAKNGYQVTAFDLTASGIEKAKRLADMHQVEVNFFRADLRQFRLEEAYDVIYSSGVLHHIPRELKAELLSNYKEHTAPGGINAVNVFVKKPYISAPPDSDGDDDTWESGELVWLYRDWKLLAAREEEFDCNSGGTPHRHCMNVLLAQKPDA